MWSQQGSKLVGSGAVGAAWQGYSVAISGDGTTTIVDGYNDNSQVGAAWVFLANGCTAPKVFEQPQNQSIQSAQTATLSVTTTGTTPLSYQWYQGNAGDTSTPVGGDVSTFTRPSLISTASSWVRVTNACGSADSATATIAVRRGVRRHLQALPSLSVEPSSLPKQAMRSASVAGVRVDGLG